MMKVATDLFDDADSAKIEAAIATAETQTAAEIVPVVATVSGRYDRAESIFGFLFALSCLILGWLFFQDVQPVEESWVPDFSLGLDLPWVIIILVVGYIVGVLLATYLPILRRPFIGRAELAEEVAEGAATAFQRFRVGRTAAGTGLVIYISLYERMVHILGDEAIGDQLSQSDWEAVRDLVVAGLQEGDPAGGLIRAINRCGELLAPHFPIQPGDRNELRNELVLLD